MINLHKQQGMAMLNLIVLLVVCAFIGKFAFTVVPMYTENTYIAAGLKALGDSDKKLEDLTDTQIKREMDNYYTINNVRSDASRKIVIVRNAEGVIVKIDYDTRDNFFYNIDLVLHFDNHLNSIHPKLCCSPAQDPKLVKY